MAYAFKIKQTQVDYVVIHGESRAKTAPLVTGATRFDQAGMLTAMALAPPRQLAVLDIMATKPTES